MTTRTTITQTPEAQLLGVDRTVATIRCPYCHQAHQHHGIQRGTVERRAAACGLWARVTPEQRATGYRFVVPPAKSTRAPSAATTTH